MKHIAIILEAIEEITNKKLKQVDSSCIAFAEKYILSDSNSCKREASRIIGNLAEQYLRGAGFCNQKSYCKYERIEALLFVEVPMRFPEL